ncbi:centrosomal protein of 162 kDa-like [Euwallacea similis]|uniref:centrosomal protein of 162 kDa-like n=1 Tax=Euwallacea similis TaxID=1736056 RepID=UPI00344D4723
METNRPGLWWMKTPQKQTSSKESVIPKLDLQKLHHSSSFTDILRKDTSGITDPDNVDVESILEEINRVAAESPLGPFDRSIGERSMDDIMKEAERVYMESSKSFEQLSQMSKTSQNISDLVSSNSKMSTPTPKSVSPLPLDDAEKGLDKEDYISDYSEDFSQDSKTDPGKSSQSSQESNKLDNLYKAVEDVDNIKLKSSELQATDLQKKSISSSSSQQKTAKSISLAKSSFKLPLSSVNIPKQSPRATPFVSSKSSPVKTPIKTASPLESPKVKLKEMSRETPLGLVIASEAPMLYQPYLAVENMNKVVELNQEIEVRNKLIKTLEDENDLLKGDIQQLKLDIGTTHALMERLKSEVNVKTLTSPEINLELDKALEELKDSKEINTSLQLQLDSANKTHQLLRSSYDDLLASSKGLERKVMELDSTLAKYKAELLNVQQTKTKLLENEINLNKLLEIEKLQSKSLKLQNEKDSKCIQDLNRQIKEMERIIARKHPDSVSALIVAAKEDVSENNLTARKLLEDRIKVLEQEVASRDSQSSKVFLEIQDKFNQMKNKYESHIEDLELHVSDLKSQLKNRRDTYDVYTQTFRDENKIPQKESFTVSVQTETVTNNTKIKITPIKKVSDGINHKEDAHLLATIRGLQADLSNKEKVVSKLQKEVDEARKTNRRLQKEREGSLRNLSEKKDFRSYPEKLVTYSRSSSVQDIRKEEELQQLKLERNRLKQQLARLEEDYQGLKKKRLDDLTALQEAHEREISNYMASVTPLREQLELQQVSVNTFQSQLIKAKEEIAVLTVERDHLNSRLLNSLHCGITAVSQNGGDVSEVETLRKKITTLEKHYEEREYRLGAIVQSLAQKSISNRSCEQCAERQQQLIGYKVELDQLLASVRALK